MDCDQCGRSHHLNRKCKGCGGVYCSNHTLPESHDCVGLVEISSSSDGPWFQEGFELTNIGADSDETPERSSTDDSSEDSKPSAERANTSDASEGSNDLRTCSECGEAVDASLTSFCLKCGEEFCESHFRHDRHDCANQDSKPVTADPARTERRAENRETKRDELERERKERYRSPDMNPDGSLGTSGYEKEISDWNGSEGASGWSTGVIRGVAERWQRMTYRYKAKSNIAIALRLFVVVAVAIVALQMLGYAPLAALEAVDTEFAGSAAEDALEGPTMDADEVEAEFLALLNDERSSRGLRTVHQRDDLRELGESHTADMVEHDYFGHVDSRGRTIEDRYEMRGLLPECELETGEGRYYPGAENLAQTYIHEHVDVPYESGTVRITDEEELAEDFFKAWMHSDGHREAMLVESASEAGVGISVTDDNRVYGALMLC